MEKGEQSHEGVSAGNCQREEQGDEGYFTCGQSGPGSVSSCRLCADDGEIRLALMSIVLIVTICVM